ncbi:PAS domain S-box protein [Paenibacillus mesotrionivorans]|uniref:PAS domain S-box protein n=1 Tax=Paenibacillus mesotrionivorans TaxID=3160968 RepID=A0ACC7NZB4_9BACL
MIRRGKTVAVLISVAFVSLMHMTVWFRDGRFPAFQPAGLVWLLGFVGTAYAAGYYYDKAEGRSRADLQRQTGAASFAEAQDKQEEFKLLGIQPDPVFLFDGNEPVYLNAAAEKWLASTRLASYRQLLQFIHPEDRKRLEGIAAPEPDQFRRMELRSLSPEGLEQESEWIFTCFLASGRLLQQVTIRGLFGQRRIRQELERSERSFNEILRHQQGIIFKYIGNAEGDFKCTLWTGELALKLGLPDERIIGRTLQEVFPPETAKSIRYYFHIAWEEERQVVFETSIASIPCLITLQPFGGEAEGREILGYCMDISERKETEAELTWTKEMLESFFNNTSDAICVTDLNGDTLHVNEAFMGLFGWSYEECIGKSVYLTVPADLQEEVQNFHEVVEFGGHISGYETRRIKRNGEEFDVSVTISPIRNNAGNAIAIASISRDITDNKRVEAALRRSEMKYRLIAENMTDIIGVLTPQGDIEYWSPSSRFLLGTEPEELMGQCVCLMIHQDDRSKLKKLLQDSIFSQAVEVVELRFRHSAGQWVVLEVSCRCIPDLELGEETNLLIVGRDITERKQAEEMLLKSEKLSVVGQLAAGVAHEIRNPLTSLKGFLQLLQQRTNENEFFFELMLSELDRINNIVSEFLVLSKPQITKMEPRNLVQVVRVVIAFLTSQALLNNVQIVTHVLTEDEVIVDCDENQLKQVFINLLKNAVESMTMGGTINVSLSHPVPGRVNVRFEDQGQGIPPERLQKLGEPFYTTKEKGTGLGLMVSFRIIQEHGGTVKVQSEVGIGTIFDVNLPVRVN